MDVIKVILVDDHAIVRAGYRFLIDTVADMRVVAEADSGEAGLTLLDKHDPDVVVLDLTMPGMGGLATIKRMLEGRPLLRILVCSMHDSSTLVERALQTGATGYFCKNGAPDAMLRAIRKVALGQAYIDPALEQSMVLQGKSERNSPLGTLSSRELQILCLYAEGKTIEQIAEELGLSNKTISNYLTLIKEKLHINTSAELVRYALSKGLALL
ncbi:MAG TPA: response regulator transcription factor [Hyphomicrobiales bacterium]|nr:response regulator transcription factor [Hyphomicrobiales bacterium]